jgi:hypothetical protein
MLGYKVMRLEGDYVISGANSRLRYPLEIGTVITMPSPGVFISLDKKYVLDYYAGLADEEALLELSFDSTDITRGNPNDKETELAVSRAVISGFELLQG